jgi:hypothetical protein
MKLREKCIIKTKVEYEWDDDFNKKIHMALKAGCDVTGKGCKSTEEFKERHTTKTERLVRECENF